jgi:hypothetical protein
MDSLKMTFYKCSDTLTVQCMYDRHKDGEP